MPSLMDDIVALAKRRAFVYPSAEIYGGFRGFWDYGPLGARLKKNLRDAWDRDMTTCSPVHPLTRKPIQIVPFDGSVITNPRVWEASGHVDRFKDRFWQCSACKTHIREDELDFHAVVVACPSCGVAGGVAAPRDYDLMFPTRAGSVVDEAVTTYLRPETAQSIFVNFDNVVRTYRVKVPFGIAQTGKAFRNEVTPRNFTFRSREFEQMEVEFFVHPSEAAQWYEFWVAQRLAWWASVGLRSERLRLHVHDREDLAHYATDGCGVTDIQYEFPFGWSELEGVAHRTDFDLRRHSEVSGKGLDYFDQEREERYFPHVIEPSAGLDRGVLAVLCDAYTVDPDRPSGIYLRFSPRISPIKLAIFSLTTKDGMPEVAESLYHNYRRRYDCAFDAKGHIGKRYARMDEIGCPFCVTVDGDTIANNTVTIRDRDTMKQIRVPLSSLDGFLMEKFAVD